MSAVDQVEKRISAANKLVGAEAPSRARQLIQRGDILVSTVRPNLNGVAIVPDEFDGATASTGFCVLRVRNQHLVNNYLMHWVRSPEFVELMIREATGASYPAVSDKIIKSSPIPLPPLDEQRRVAAILDKADELRRKRKRVVDLLQELIVSLVARYLDDEGLATSIELGEVIAEGPTNGLYKPSSSYGEGVPILRIDSFYDGNITNVASLKRLRISEAELKRFHLEIGDLIINRVNSLEYLGKSAIVQRLFEPTVFESNMMKFRVDPSILLPEVCIALLQTPAIKQQILGKAKNAVNQSSINQADVKGLRLPLPPMSAQRKFLGCAKQIEPLRAKVDREQKSLSSLFSSLQHRAFSGQL